MEKARTEKKWSLVAKIVLSVTLIILVFGAVAVSLVSKLVYGQLLQQKQEQLSNLTLEQAHESEIVLSKTHAIIGQIAKNRELIAYLIKKAPEVQNGEIVELLNEFNIGNSFSALYLIAVDGTTMVSTDQKLVGQNYGFREYFTQAMEGEPGFDVAVGVTTGELEYYLAMPVVLNDHVLAVVAGKMRPTVLLAEIRQNDAEALIESRPKKYLVDKYGVVIFTSEQKKLFSSLGELPVNLLDETTKRQRYGNSTISALDYQVELDAVLSGTTRNQRKFDDVKDGEFEILTLAKVNNYPIYAFSEMDVDKTLAAVKAVVLMISSVVIVGVFVTALIVAGLIAAWLKPLANMRQLATKIAEGDFDSRITDLSDDELGDLARSFNRMTDSLVKAKKNVEQQVDIRTSELSKLNQFMVGRELKMVELKKQLREVEDEKN